MKAAREEAGCAALPGEEVGCAALPEALPEVLVLSFVLLDTGRSALFDAAREEAGRFIAVVTMDAGKTLEPHVRTISCMQEKLKKLWLRNCS